MKSTHSADKLSNHFTIVVTFVTILILFCLAAVLATALFTYHSSDPAWSHNHGDNIQNTLGVVGAWYSDLSFSLIGKMSYLLPIALLVLAFHAWIEKGIDKELLSWRLFMLLTAILSGCVLWANHDLEAINTVAQTGGGALGAWLSIGLEKSIKSTSVIMAFSLIIFIISLSLLLNFPWFRVMDGIGRQVSRFFALLFTGFNQVRDNKQHQRTMKSQSDNTDTDLKQKIDAVNQLQQSELDNNSSPHFVIDRYDHKAGKTTDDHQLSAAQQAANRSGLATDVTPDEYNDIDLSMLGISNRKPQKKRPPLETEPQHKEPQHTRFDHQHSTQPKKSLIDDIPINTQQTVAPEQDIPLDLSPAEAVKEIQHEHALSDKAEPTFFDFDRIKKSSVSLQTPKANRLIDDFTAEQQITDWTPAINNTPDEHQTPIEPTQQAPISETRPPINEQHHVPNHVDSLKSTATDLNHVDSPTPKATSPEQPIQQPPQPTQQSITVEQSVAPPTPPVSNASIDKPYQKPAVTLSDEKPKHYQLPGIDLLDTPPPQENAYTEDTLAEMATILETTLKQFNVDATVMRVSPGPVITRFEIDLAPGIQAKKITNLSQDLARALAVSRVRVEEVITGSSYVGLEVPNKSRQVVYFKDVICSSAFQKSRSPLTISLGSDTSGKPVVADLMKMPHALVAGTTGSGKSVCINAMLLSMLYKSSPKDLRLILVDPKMLEMSMYEDIPHLLTPVITDMNEAENALTWAVGEMERRYQLMAALKVRKIDVFNQHIDEANARGETIKDPLWQPDESVGYTHHPNLERLPFIVIIIDELADMMMVVGKQVEQLIARLTQKARAAGIHVVLATQRPSTDVLTGLIKANVPTRIAFQVSSGTDSRVIIDGMGAEKLLGHGDMLYVPPGSSHPQRLHGAFVGDAETDRITDYLRSTSEADYIEGITRKQDPESLGAYGAAEAAGAKEDADPLYEEAIRIVLETNKASISSVQRQLRIGYNRAARMIEDMQEQGIVSEPVNGIRKVLGAPKSTDDN